MLPSGQCGARTSPKMLGKEGEMEWPEVNLEVELAVKATILPPHPSRVAFPGGERQQQNCAASKNLNLVLSTQYRVPCPTTGVRSKRNRTRVGSGVKGSCWKIERENGDWSQEGVTCVAKHPSPYPNPFKCARSSGQTLDIESIISSNFQK